MIHRKTRHLLVVLSAALPLCASTVANAGTYWVHPSGSAAWAVCESENDPNSSYCSLTTANVNAQAGDTVYLKGGTYAVASALLWGAIGPEHSGTGVGTRRIVFASAPNNATNNPPVLTPDATNPQPMAVYLGNLGAISYVKIDGITFRNFEIFAEIYQGSSHNEITNCSFVSDPGYEGGAGFNLQGDPSTGVWCTDNWVHNNYISGKRNGTDACGEAVDLITVGAGGDPARDDHNTFEDNYLEHGGHSLVNTCSHYNVIRNNIMHNEPWITGCSPACNVPTYDNPQYNGKYAHRIMQLGEDAIKAGNYNLVERNRIGYSSLCPGLGGGSAEGIAIASPRNIVRYNFIYGAIGGDGIYLKWANAYGDYSGGVDNRLFNNTIYHNGYGWNYQSKGTCNCSYEGVGIDQGDYTGTPSKNVILNNIVYGNRYGDICSFSSGSTPTCNSVTYDDVVNNWITSTGDPRFTNPDLTDVLNQNMFPSVHGYSPALAPDLSLDPASGAIDYGVALTTAIGSRTNSTSLVVKDAMYFQDGTMGADIARNVTMFPDWIAIGAVDNAVQIQSVEYDTDTITLSSAATWSDGASVWLYRDSRGGRVLYGKAPDVGAYEYGSSAGAGGAAGATALPQGTGGATTSATASGGIGGSSAVPSGGVSGAGGIATSTKAKGGSKGCSCHVGTAAVNSMGWAGLLGLACLVSRRRR